MFKSLKLPAGGEIGIVALVIAIISLMILPLPPVAIDLLLGINITISVTLLMVTMYVPDIAALSAFPSLLLFTTLFRLSLNIASTKSILLHAEAGNIIESFGQLVVGGNLVVGLVVFAIITTVQFIVIAKGSERVAEVGARFTLDALPGKQMSIDADLRSGLLSTEEARKKRATLAVESQLHGGMDGAMKFVKGDAIAGLIITMINIVAGIAVGVAYHGMSAGDAANRFSVLSVGDAMVSQIPSLLLSVAAGVMITRVTDERAPKRRSLGDEISHQLGSKARVHCISQRFFCSASPPCRASPRRCSCCLPPRSRSPAIDCHERVRHRPAPLADKSRRRCVRCSVRAPRRTSLRSCRARLSSLAPSAFGSRRISRPVLRCRGSTKRSTSSVHACRTNSGFLFPA